MTPADILDGLIAGKQRESERALKTILGFSHPENTIPMDHRVEVLKNCGPVDQPVLTKIVMTHLFSPIPEVRESILDLVRDHLDRKGRLGVIAALLAAEEEHQRLAISLARDWGSQVYGELLLPLLKDDSPITVKAVAETLAHISLPVYLKDLSQLLGSEQNEIRLALAEQLNQSPGILPTSMVRTCLSDALSTVRMVGLNAIQGQDPADWVKELVKFVAGEREEDEWGEAIKLLGISESPKAVPPLVDLFFQHAEAGRRWSILQALDRIEEQHRLAVLGKRLKESQEEGLPHLYELLGNCRSNEALAMLRGEMQRHQSNPGLRSLIAGAMGQCGHPGAETDLLPLLRGDISEAYAAAAALKALVKGKVMGHFKELLDNLNIDPLVHQILLQHVTDSSLSLHIPDDLRHTIENFLDNDNENCRYLAIVALKEIASVDSLPRLVDLQTASWTEMFRSDVDAAIESCSNGKLRPLLELYLKASLEERKNLIDFILAHPLHLTGQDLELLNSAPDFQDCNWDEDLLHCIERTQEEDRSFVWRQFSDRELSDMLCCFLARGFDMSHPQKRDVLDPEILIQCFHRFKEEKTLILLGRLMSNFPRAEFIPILVQYSESAPPDISNIFRSYVQSIVLGMQT